MHECPRTTIVTILLCVMAGLAAHATPARAQVADEAVLAAIRAEGIERSRVAGVFDTLTTIIGPRLSGSPSYDAAAEWTRAWLSAQGMANARLEPFEFGRGWSLEKLTLEMTAPRVQTLVGYAEAWTPSTDGVVTGRPIYVGDMTAEQITALGDRVRGAIVLALRPQTVFTRADRPQPTESDEPVRTGAPQRAQGETGDSEVRFNQMAGLLRDLGAAVVLRPSRGEHGTVFVLGNRNTDDDAVPSLILSTESYNSIVRLVEAGQPVALRIELRTTYHEADPTSHNVIAEIPGTDPALRDEIVLLGAHLDSWHTAAGAADNADGVAVAMEAMRILRAVDARPARTIRVALWGGEEQGLLGSRAYVERHLSGPDSINARARHVVYLNDDPGSGPTYGWYMEGDTARMATFDAWLAPLLDLGARRNVIEGIPSTDHLSFMRVGVPGFTAIKEYTNYDRRMHHTNADTPERIREEDLRQAAVVLATFAWRSAMAR